MRCVFKCFSLLVALLLVQACSSKPESPNIIYILADDLGYGDLSCYGQEKFKTPHIDQLAAEGMLFTQHYAGSTVCAPSRSCLLTGQSTGHTPIRGNRRVKPVGNWPLPAAAYTLAEMLHDAGYRAGAFGKWGLGYLGTEGDPNSQGFDDFYGYYSQTLAHHYFPDQLWHNGQKIELAGNQNGDEEQYAPYLIHDAAISFLEEHSKQPFFMYYASPLPHAEMKVPEQVLKKHSGNYGLETPYQGTDFGQEGFRLGLYGSASQPKAAFVSMIEILDQQVGDLMSKLDELGISENTIVIFTSDNGPHREGGADPDYFDSNGVCRGYKRDLYEGGIRVPMIVKWPGRIKASSRTDHVSAFWDVFPTVAEICDTQAPVPSDGLSFLPALIGQEQKAHDYLYWEFYELGGRQALLKDNWKLVRYNLLDTANTTTELYYLPDDPSESNDLSRSNPEVLARLTQLLSAAREPSEIFEFKN